MPLPIQATAPSTPLVATAHGGVTAEPATEGFASRLAAALAEGEGERGAGKVADGRFGAPDQAAADAAIAMLPTDVGDVLPTTVPAPVMEAPVMEAPNGPASAATREPWFPAATNGDPSSGDPADHAAERKAARETVADPTNGDPSMAIGTLLADPLALGLPGVATPGVAIPGAAQAPAQTTPNQTTPNQATSDQAMPADVSGGATVGETIQDAIETKRSREATAGPSSVGTGAAFGDTRVASFEPGPVNMSRAPDTSAPQASAGDVATGQNPAETALVGIRSTTLDRAASATAPPDLPARPAPILDQIAPTIQMIGRGQGGDARLIVRLEPESLGRVEISIERRADAPVRVRVIADREETLALLTRDRANLMLALDRAGIRPDREMVFQLAGGDLASSTPSHLGTNTNGRVGGDGARDGRPDGRPRGWTGFPDLDDGATDRAGMPTHSRRSRAGLDIVA